MSQSDSNSSDLPQDQRDFYMVVIRKILQELKILLGTAHTSYLIGFKHSQNLSEINILSLHQEIDEKS